MADHKIEPDAAAGGASGPRRTGPRSLVEAAEIDAVVLAKMVGLTTEVVRTADRAVHEIAAGLLNRRCESRDAAARPGGPWTRRARLAGDIPFVEPDSG